MFSFHKSNNFKNEIKSITKELTSNSKNEHENDQISICRKTKNKKDIKNRI